jgi:hypothetical protein
VIARRLRACLEDLQKAMPVAVTSPGGSGTPLAKDTLRKLESLGYVGEGVGGGQPDPDSGNEDPKDFVAVFELCKTGLALMGQRPTSTTRRN